MNKIFFPFQISGMNIESVREAYRGLRSVANKRLSRLEAQKLGQMGSYRFPAAGKLTDNQLREQLADVSRYVRDPRHTVRGEKRFMREEIESLHDQGYDWINQENFYDFVNYMDELREQYGNKAFDSGDAADVFSNAQRIGIDPKVLKTNYEYFAEHLNELERMRPARSEWGASFEGIKQKINKLSR